MRLPWLAVLCAATVIGANACVAHEGQGPTEVAPAFHIPTDELRVPTPPPGWPQGFRRVDVPDSEGNFGVYRAATEPDRPIVISLHTWNGDGLQFDHSLHLQALEADWNFFRPDLGGPNDDPDTCCSDLLLTRLERAIEFAVELSDGHRDQVHVVGSSGGGYTALCYFMHAREPFASLHAWVPIVDLEAWYQESVDRSSGFDEDILACTGSGLELDVEEALRRSPLHMAPSDLLGEVPLYLYAGIDDGHLGVVPITHALNMFDRLAVEAGREPLPPAQYAAAAAAKRDALHAVALLGDRKIWLRAQHPELSLTIFEGGHEILLAPAAAAIDAGHP